MKKIIMILCILASGLFAAPKQPDFNSKEWQDKFAANDAGIEAGWNSCGCPKIAWSKAFPNWHKADAKIIAENKVIYKDGYKDGQDRCKAFRLEVALARSKK